MKIFKSSKTGHTGHTGHAASDAYFKNAPIWHDVDMIKAWFLGAFTGPIILWIIANLFI